MTLRRAGVCAACGAALEPGERGCWDGEAKVVYCLPCHHPRSQAVEPNQAVPDRGRPGASAARGHERRRANREIRTRQAHPRIGGLLLALREAPQHERAWDTGAKGEVAVGQSLEARTAESPVVLLHDRRMPGSRGNIDHLAIAPTGIYVIDAKAHQGKVRIQNPLFGTGKLTINGRDCTKLLDGLDGQIAAVRKALPQDVGVSIQVQGALCFTTADLPFLRTQTMRGHLLIYRRALAKRLNAQGPLTSQMIETIASALATTLLPAR